MEAITWTIIWSSEQNAVQIISLMFVNEKWKCDGNENVMLNERETKLLGQENNNPDDWTNNNGIILRNTNLMQLQRMKWKKQILKIELVS